MNRIKRPSSTQIVIAFILAGLGFALATQIRSNSNAGLQNLPQSDLVRILDDVTSKNSRLEAERGSLLTLNGELSNGTASSATAIEAARVRADALGIISGLLPAVGPGITLSIFSPKETLVPELLVGILNELRDAGAEVIEISGIGTDGNVKEIRIVGASSVQTGGSISAFRIDGTVIKTPITFRAIGEPATMSAALNIAGGVTDQIRRYRAGVSLATNEKLTIKSIATLAEPRYAQTQK